MSVAVSLPPSGFAAVHALLRRFSVDEYHQMVRTGILNEDEPVELLEGWIVIKMPRNPEHDLTLERSEPWRSGTLAGAGGYASNVRLRRTIANLNPTFAVSAVRFLPVRIPPATQRYCPGGRGRRVESRS